MQRDDTFLYVDVSCLMHQHKDIAITKKKKKKKILNEDSENIYGWFVDNKLSIHFQDDKTTSILFASKQRAKNIRKLNIRYTKK